MPRLFRHRLLFLGPPLLFANAVTAQPMSDSAPPPTVEPAVAAAARDGGGDSWHALEAGAAAGPDVPVIGAGAFAYRFTLRDPHGGAAQPNTAFALATGGGFDQDLPFVPDDTDVYQGTTDAEGRTPVFRLPTRLPDRAWDLRERFGSGPYGESFRLLDQDSKGLADHPYLLVLCTTPPRIFTGHSYPGGDTAYTASPTPATVELHAEDGAITPDRAEQLRRTGCSGPKAASDK